MLGSSSSLVTLSSFNLRMFNFRNNVMIRRGSWSPFPCSQCVSIHVSQRSYCLPYPLFWTIFSYLIGWVKNNGHGRNSHFKAYPRESLLPNKIGYRSWGPIPFCLLWTNLETSIWCVPYRVSRYIWDLCCILPFQFSSVLDQFVLGNVLLRLLKVFMPDNFKTYESLWKHLSVQLTIWKHAKANENIMNVSSETGSDRHWAAKNRPHLHCHMCSSWP